ncbi:hypothetical protein Afe04nite_58220 [Asanoa ferruginea]|nr:hypothetical protein Afe04nite_58220 [Asanoa ferruginea]
MFASGVGTGGELAPEREHDAVTQAAAQDGLEGVGAGLLDHPRGRHFGGVVQRGVVVDRHPCGAVRKNAHRLRR